jgi:hypothetical protein
MTISALFPEACNYAYVYDQGYEQVLGLNPGDGCWLYSATSHSTEIVGVPIENLSLNLDQGWNMIGGVSGPVDFSDPQDTPDQSVLPVVYHYDPLTSEYTTTDYLQPPLGCWVKSTGPCMLTLTTTAAPLLSTLNTVAVAFSPPPPPGFSNVDPAKSTQQNSFTLYPAYPNPFQGKMTICLELPYEQPLDVNIYSIRGKIVRHLFKDQKPAGLHKIHWYGTDDEGNALPSGLYLISARSLNDEQIVKTMRIK